MAMKVDVDFCKPTQAELATLGVGKPFVTVESYNAMTPAVAMAIGIPDSNGDIPCLVTNTGQDVWLPFTLPSNEKVFPVDRMCIDVTLLYN